MPPSARSTLFKVRRKRIAGLQQRSLKLALHDRRAATLTSSRYRLPIESSLRPYAALRETDSMRAMSIVGALIASLKARQSID